MSEKFIASLLVGFLVAGCASPTVVQSVKPGDAGLNCAQLQNEFADADNFKKEADGVKGVTGGNVARLLFWPSIVGTYMNANEAIAAAENRKVNLSNLMSQKGCAVPGAIQSSESNSTNQQVSQAQTTEMKLVDLKKLFDNNLISRETYEQRQKAILEGR
jgi:hypothetical protein